MIEFKNVTKQFANGTKALRDFNLHIEPGEFVFILGASGAGKSTFLKLIMREEVASEGTVTVNNIDLGKIKPRKIPYYRRHLGIVFQDFRLIPKMRVYDNVAFAMRAIGAREKDVNRRVSYALSLVGLSSKTKNLPSELSGGEQQRVALARALVNDADILIADEPTGNIDPEMSYEIVELLNRINENGTTVIMVTHEHELIKKFNKRVVKIANGTVVSDTKHPELEIETQTEDSTDYSTTKITGYFEDTASSDYYESFLEEYAQEQEIVPEIKTETEENAEAKGDDVVSFTPGTTENDIISQKTGRNFKNVGEDIPDFSKFFENGGEENG